MRIQFGLYSVLGALRATSDWQDVHDELQRMPRRSRPPTVRLVAIAACFILVLAIDAVLMATASPVVTVPPAESLVNTTACRPAQSRAHPRSPDEVQVRSPHPERGQLSRLFSC